MIPARVRSSGSRDARGNLHSDAELERHAFKMRGSLLQANLKLVRMIDRRIKRLVMCSSMSKSVRDAKDDPSNAHRHPSVERTV